jgi:hypothetical protein
MNAIRGFSAPLNGVQPGHLAKMSSRQKQETRGGGLSGTHTMTNVENLFQTGSPGIERGGPRVKDSDRY